jgi:formylglycine-generating enzyme required for sulfatase activity
MRKFIFKGYNFLKFVIILSTFSFIVIGCGVVGGRGARGVAPANGGGTVQATIRPGGGLVEVTDPIDSLFGASIDIPSGAVDEDTVISMTKVSLTNDLPEHVQSAGKVIEFGPEGMVFNADVTITMPYNDVNDDGIVDGTGIDEEYVAVYTYDEKMEKWLCLNKIDQDKVNNTVTFTANYFSKCEVGAINISVYGRNDVSFFSIDGLEFDRIIGPGIQDNFRPSYLEPALINGMALGLNSNDVIVFGKGNVDSWHGDANYTQNIVVKELVKTLNSWYNEQHEALHKKTIIITHSWGTVLGFLALMHSNVNPDLFITLSSPLGTQNIFKSTKNPLDGVVVTYVQKQILDTEIKIANYRLLHFRKYPPYVVKAHDPYFGKWINYWAYGDIFSGPIKPDIMFRKTYTPPARLDDKKIDESNTERDWKSTKIWHGITSLNEDKWDKHFDGNTMYLDMGKSFRDEVERTIKNFLGDDCHGVDTDCDGCVDTAELIAGAEKRKKAEITTAQYSEAINNWKACESGSSYINSLGMTFKLISPGTFMMGNPSDPFGYTTYHQVTLTKPFYMQTTEVTQDQWGALMGSNPSKFKNCGASCPVDSVSWDNAQSFLAELNSMGEGTYRLPTDAEWEYAARGGSTTDLPNGNLTVTGCEYDPNLDIMEWYCYNADGKTHPVAQKQPNAWGLYDMHGNVMEWCQDWFGLILPEPVNDPIGPSTGDMRVIRGGLYSFSAENCTSDTKSGEIPDYENGNGFRIVREP